MGFPNPCHVNYTSLMISFTKHVCQHGATSGYISARLYNGSSLRPTWMIGNIKSKMQLYFPLLAYSSLVNLQSRPEMHVGDMIITSFVPRYQANLIFVIVQICRPVTRLYIDTPSPNYLLTYKHLNSFTPINFCQPYARK